MSSVGRRLAQHVAFRRRRLRLRSRSWVLGGHDPKNAVWICSWQRSGSTWLAEMLASAPRTRLVYEPANLLDNCFDGVDAATIPLPHESAQHAGVVELALQGRTPHHWWVDQFNTSHWPERTVVKDVRALGIAGAVAQRAPQTPIIILIRNPLDVAASVLRLGWFAPDLSPREAYLAEVARWSEMHEAAFADPRLQHATWISYEELLESPRERLGELRDTLLSHSTAWRALDVDAIETEERSQTDFANDRGHAVEPAWVVEATERLRGSLFGRYYDAPKHHVGTLQHLLDSRGSVA